MHFGLKVRVGLTLSAIWVCLVFLLADSYQSSRSTFGIAALPLVLLWGIGWVVMGWLENRRKSRIEGQTSTTGGRKTAFRYATTILVILLSGVIFANWHAEHRMAQAVAREIPRMIGEWSVYTLFAYLAFRYAPGFTRSIPGLLAAMFFVAGVNYSNYKQVDLLVTTRASLAAATPILMQIQSGRPIEASDIRAANIGLFEPIVIAAADSAKRITAAQTQYQKELAESGFGVVLAPATLSTPSGRARARLTITTVERLTNDYLLETEAALKAGNASVKSAVMQMPKELSTVFDSYKSKTDQSLQNIQELRVIENGLIKCAKDIVTLLDNASGTFHASPGPQQLLLFQQPGTASAYNSLIARFAELAKQEGDLNERVRKQRVEGVDKLTNALDEVN